MLGDNAESINIAVSGVDSESVTSESVDLAAQLAVEVFWKAAFLGDLADELFDELVQLRQDLDSVRKAVCGVKRAEGLDRF